MAETTSAIPDPGTEAALMRGCECPVIDNGHGKGWRGQLGVFVYTFGCPLHCPVRSLSVNTGKGGGDAD